MGALLEFIDECVFGGGVFHGVCNTPFRSTPCFWSKWDFLDSDDMRLQPQEIV